MNQSAGDEPSSKHPVHGESHKSKATTSHSEPSQSESTQTPQAASSSNVVQSESSQPAPASSPTTTTVPSIQPYQPYTFSYREDQGLSQYSQPVVFTGPHPDNDPYDEDNDSAIDEYDSAESLTLDDKSYEFRHEFSRRYHAEREGVEYHLPNGSSLTLFVNAFLRGPQTKLS
jgi:hypothetical protein